MSEVDARPPATRGRSSHRGGRGGFGRGGARGGRKLANGSNTDGATHDFDSLDEQGELGEMKKKYASELPVLKDMFPEWTDVDLVFALHEADGDIPSTVDHITQGNVSQFAEVKSSKDRARSKMKDSSTSAGGVEKTAVRPGRGRGGSEITRGTRGRGSERGRGGTRGGRGGYNATKPGVHETSAVSVPTTESAAWDDSAGTNHVADAAATPNKDGVVEAGGSGISSATPPDAPSTAVASATKGAGVPGVAPKKSWASMFAPKPHSAEVNQTPAPPAVPTAKAPPESVAVEPEIQLEEAADEEQHAATASDIQTAESESTRDALPEIAPGSEEEENLTPSNVPLTEENVEHLPDESHPPATLTVASTAGSADPRNLTPLPSQQPSTARPPVGGYATSAQRAAGGMRSSSFQRRVQEQQEAVVMPGHNALDRATVQFGSMGLNGEPGPDVDEDREEPETRQAPQHSPPSQPRTSLPPVARQASGPLETAETQPTTKPAPGLPPAVQQNQQQVQEAMIGSKMPADTGNMGQGYNQYARYGQPGPQHDSVTQQQKPYDPFSHQAQVAQYDQYGVHAQQIPMQQQQQQGAHSGFGGHSSVGTDASAHYNEQQRNAYQQYYGNTYAQQDMRSATGQAHQHEYGSNQQRSASGFSAGPNDSAFGSQNQQQAQSRFGDTSGSGHNTPNPPTVSQQPQTGTATSAQMQQSMHQATGHQQQGGYNTGHAGYPYGHPYYNSPYQQAYNNQFGFNHQLGGYGGSYQGKQNMYAGSHGYGMGPQSSYEQHSSSPANASGFGQNQQSSMRSASGMSGIGGGLEEYGRTSVQSHQQTGGFGTMNDPFARSASGLGGQGSYSQQSMAGPDESLKAFSENKGGPSPALSQQGRPGSASNNSNQSGLPPPQNHQSGFGGYPGFPTQSFHGGLGGLGTPQHGQNTMGGQGYGSYGAGGFGQTYGSYSSRGGWGSNYGAH